MGKLYDNLITTTAGFKYDAPQPLDDRSVVQSYSDLSELVNSNVTYEGMEVYVVDDKTSYKLIDSEWNIVATEDYVTEKIMSLKNDIDKLQKSDAESAEINDRQQGDLDTLLKRPTQGLAYELTGSGQLAYYTCTGMGTATSKYIIIASEIDGIPVTRIGQGFANQRLESLDIPASVEVFPMGSLYNAAKNVIIRMHKYMAPDEGFGDVYFGSTYVGEVYPFEYYEEKFMGYDEILQTDVWNSIRYMDTFTENIFVKWTAPYKGWGASNAILHENALEASDVEYEASIVGTEAELNQEDDIPESGRIVIYEPDENYTYYRLKMADGKTALKDFNTLPLMTLPPIPALDDNRLKSYTADYVDEIGNITDKGGTMLGDGSGDMESESAQYYFSPYNYNIFMKKNRVYTERGLNSSGKWRGPYNMNTLNDTASAIKNPWIYKESWWAHYYNNNKRSLTQYASADEYVQACRKNKSLRVPPSPSQFFGLDSTVQRLGDSDGYYPGSEGHIKVPSMSINAYDKLSDATKKIADNFAITKVYADSAISSNNDKVVSPLITDKTGYAIINVGEQRQDKQIYIKSNKGVFSKMRCNLQAVNDFGDHVDGDNGKFIGCVFRSYISFNGYTKGSSGIQFELTSDNGNKSLQLMLGNGIIITNYNYNQSNPDYPSSTFKRTINVPELIGNSTILLEIRYAYNFNLIGQINICINGNSIMTCPPWMDGGRDKLTIATTLDTEGEIEFTNTAFYETVLIAVNDMSNSYQHLRPQMPITIDNCYDLDSVGEGQLPLTGAPIIMDGNYSDKWIIRERDISKDLANKEYIWDYSSVAINKMLEEDIKTEGKIELGKDASGEMDAVALHQLQEINLALNHQISQLNDYINLELKKVQGTFKDIAAYEGNLNGSEGLTYVMSEDGTYAICTGETSSTGTKRIATTYQGVPVTEIGENAFANSSSVIYIPSSIKKISKGAFNTSSATVYINDLFNYMNITFADAWATSPFNRMSTGKIHIENSCNGIINIPEGIKVAKARCFQGIKSNPYVKSVKFPESLTTIEPLAFSAIGVEELVIPAHITRIDASAFQEAPNLTSVIFEGTPKALNSTAFKDSNNITHIYVPWSSDSNAVPGSPWDANNATVYYYSETKPKSEGDYWHYVDGEPQIWQYSTVGLQYELSEDGDYYTCTGLGSVTEEDVVIANSINGIPVTHLSSTAFKNKTINSLTTPENMYVFPGGSLYNAAKKVIIKTPDFASHEVNGFGEYSNIMGSEQFLPYYPFNDQQYIANPDIMAGGMIYQLSDDYYTESIHVRWNQADVWGAPWGAKNAEVFYNQGNDET